MHECATYEHILGCPGGKSNIGRHTELLILNMEHYSTVNIYATFEPGPVSHETNKKADIRAEGYNLPPRHADWAVVSPGSQV